MNHAPFLEAGFGVAAGRTGRLAAIVVDGGGGGVCRGGGGCL